MKHSALDMADLVTQPPRPQPTSTPKHDSRAGWLVAASIVVVVTAVAAPFSASADPYSSCREVHDINGSTIAVRCIDNTDGSIVSFSPQEAP